MEQTLLIRNIRREPDASDEAFVSSCKKRWGIPADEPLRFRIVRQALDARKKQDICFVVHAEITADKRLIQKLLKDRRLNAELTVQKEEEPLKQGTEHPDGRIIVVGMGPGGLFAAWMLARYGYRPLVIERGKRIEDRVRDVETYWSCGRLRI